MPGPRTTGSADLPIISIRESAGPDALISPELGKRSRLDDKYLAHGLRMGLHARHTETTGQRLERLPDEIQTRLRALKAHQMAFDETLGWFEELSTSLLSVGRTPDADGQPVFLYDAVRAAHLGRGSEVLRDHLTQHFRAAFGSQRHSSRGLSATLALRVSACAPHRPHLPDRDIE